MGYPMSEGKPGPLRVDFERRLKLEFHGSKVTTDAGLLSYREREVSVELTEMAGDVLADCRTGKNGLKRFRFFFKIRTNLRDCRISEGDFDEL